MVNKALKDWAKAKAIVSKRHGGKIGVAKKGTKIYKEIRVEYNKLK